MYSISYDPDHAFVRVELRGFWSIELVDRYCDALQELIGSLVGAGNRFALLIDAREYPLQNPDVSARFLARTPDWPPPGEGPVAGVAMIVASTLSKLQAERTIGAGVMFFHDADEAEQWLAAQLGGPGV